jgi:hypothetical protein
MIPRHQWTHDGDEVLVVRFCASDGSSSHGFVWPLTLGAAVIAPDWDETPKCGNGLHGWPWGFSIGDGCEPDWSATWLVIGVQPATVVSLGGKVKFPVGVVRYVGDWAGAASATGERGAASATGWSGAASATGESGAAVVTGPNGRARAGSAGCIALGWWNPDARQMEMRCARTGRQGDQAEPPLLKPHTWYRLDARGEFVEDET